MKRASILKRAESHGDWLLIFTDTVRETRTDETHELLTDAIARANELGADRITMSEGIGDMTPASVIKD